MRRKSYLALFSCLFTLSCNDTIDPDTSGKFIKLYGGALNEKAYAVEEIPGQGFIIVGSTESIGQEGKNVFVIRTDRNGNRSQEGGFDKGILTFNESIPGEGRSVLVDANGNLLVLGYTTVNAKKDFLLLSIDAAGNTIEKFTYGDPSADEEGYFLSPSRDGGYLLIGNTQQSGDAQEGSVYLVKVLPALQQQFQKTYGLFNESDLTGNIIETDNGNLVWCGTVERGSYTAARVVTSDAFGNLISDSQFRRSKTNITGKNIRQISGGYVVVGTSIPDTTTAKASIFLINTNGSQGDTIVVNKTDAAEGQYGNAIYPTSDGNYIITGKTVSGTNSDVLLLKCTRQGEVLWKKTFGGGGPDEGTFVKQTADGGYIMLATIEISNNSAIALIKTDAEGKSVGSLARP